MAAIFSDDISKQILLNENVRILVNNSLNFVPCGPVGYKTASVQIMAWCREGDKPLSNLYCPNRFAIW